MRETWELFGLKGEAQKKRVNFVMIKLIGRIGFHMTWCLGWTVAFAMIFGTPAWAAGTPQRVLILFSNDRLLPANQRLEEGIRQTLDPAGDEKSVIFFAEFLDVVRFNGQEVEEVMAEYLTKRYGSVPPDIVVALGQQALNFMAERRDAMFPAAPLVFGGVTTDKLEAIEGMTEVVGLPMLQSAALLVEAALQMRPETREIFFVSGVSPFDQTLRKSTLAQCASFSDRVKITAFPTLPLRETKARLSGLDEDSLIVYLSYFESPTGETYIPARVAKEISGAANVPVFGSFDTYIGTGVLGVSVSPFKEEGIILGKLIRRLLDGTKPEEIGILPPTSPRLILDANAMDRWGITEHPPSAEVRFRTPSLWKEHRTEMLVGLSVVVLQGMLIAGLILSKARRRRIESELLTSEARFSDVFTGSPVAMCIVRQSDGRIIDVNPEWVSIIGLPRAEVLGKTPLETGFKMEGDADQRYRLFLDSGKPLTDFEQKLVTPDGTARILSISSQLTSLHGESCLIMAAKDTTDLHEEQSSRHDLARTMRMAILGEMTALIAHEINQPLGAIQSNTDAAEMLLKKQDPALGEVKLILSDIRKDNRRASIVIQKVRAFVASKEVNKVPTDLNLLLTGSIARISPEARRRGVTIERELAQNLPFVEVDPVQVEQVMDNLFSNAIEAMHGVSVASRTMVIRSAVRSDGNTVEACVEDCGHGIPADQLPKIFESFHTSKNGGMGLGLALSRSIAEAHGGSLHARNLETGGSIFCLFLPIHKIQPAH